MDFKALKQVLSKLDAACICDANKKLRVMSPEICPVSQGLKMVGIAHTVQCASDFLMVIKALQDAKEDEVLVLAAGGKKLAVAGELFATEAKRKGLAGIVIDGGCRDTKQIRKIQFPVYSKYITPLAGTLNKISQTQIQVVCGGVTVSPEDIIFGDDDGIVVMSKKESQEILNTAQSIQEKEEKILEMMAEDKSLLEMLNFSEHYEKISKGKESKLIFTV